MSDQPASGGAGPGGIASAGGDGGAGDAPDGLTAATAGDAGGGGGALGRIRINAGNAPTLDGVMSPSHNSGALTIGSLLVTPN